jgi:mannose-6-phosphate isomerase-like protein (cupin superfamily)
MTHVVVKDLSSTYLRLRPDVSVEVLGGGDAFWKQLAAGELGSFHNEFLVSGFVCDSDWPMWEMHPRGDEVVCLLSGSVTFILETSAGPKEVELTSSGAFIVVPRGTWHTAKVREPSKMLFITAGEGTQHKPVDD